MSEVIEYGSICKSFAYMLTIDFSECAIFRTCFVLMNHIYLELSNTDHVSFVSD